MELREIQGETVIMFFLRAEERKGSLVEEEEQEDNINDCDLKR